ncbi:DUF4365 domain-containing protein [Micromonospora sp. NPDC051141]|uniref:DUF4365 domain-containing protein n=1 Tax=Micromonospora sp. NPDC051141 TaxID=3364284 RepID=UPI0037970C05
MLGGQPEQPAELTGLRPGEREDPLLAARRDHLHPDVIHHGPLTELRDVLQVSPQTLIGEGEVSMISRRVNEIGFLYHDRRVDHGIDGEIELVADGNALNQVIMVQSKANNRPHTDQKGLFSSDTAGERGGGGTPSGGGSGNLVCHESDHAHA